MFKNLFWWTYKLRTMTDTEYEYYLIAIIGKF